MQALLAVAASNMKMDLLRPGRDDGLGVGGELIRRKWKCGMKIRSAAAIETGLQHERNSTLTLASQQSRDRSNRLSWSESRNAGEKSGMPDRSAVINHCPDGVRRPCQASRTWW